MSLPSDLHPHVLPAGQRNAGGMDTYRALFGFAMALLVPLLMSHADTAGAFATPALVAAGAAAGILAYLWARRLLTMLVAGCPVLALLALAWSAVAGLVR